MNICVGGARLFFFSKGGPDGKSLRTTGLGKEKCYTIWELFLEFIKKRAGVDSGEWSISVCGFSFVYYAFCWNNKNVGWDGVGLGGVGLGGGARVSMDHLEVSCDEVTFQGIHKS